MGKEKLSLVQLFLLIVNFELGSSIVLGLASKAGNDAWIAVVAASIFGAVLLWFYHLLVSKSGNKNLYEIMEFCFGRKISIILAFLYITYFMNVASRIVRDFCELLASAILPNTPMEVMSVTFCLVIGYIMYLGIEVLARTNEIFSPYLLFFIVLLTILIFASGKVDLQQLEPVLGNGIAPIGEAIFPELLTFPFGELVAFTVIFPLVAKKQYTLRVSIWGLAMSTAILVISLIITIASLGVDGMQRSNFPLLMVARLISIGGFVERVEAVVVFIMMLGILVKGSVFIFCALKGLEYVFRLPYRYFSVPVSMAVSLFTVLIALNFADQIEEGLIIVPKILHPPFQFGLPAIIFLFLSLKLGRRKNQMREAKQ